MAVKFFGGLAALSIGFLLIGFLLPGTWTVQRTAAVDAPPSVVFPFVNEVARWSEWTPWPDVGVETFGPPGGVGAGLRWDDAEMGDGEFSITGSEGDRRVAYRVAVQGGSLLTRGTLELEPDGPATLVTWTESGDFGWNPILGWVALFMDRLQGREMEKGLARLSEVARQESPVPDSG